MATKVMAAIALVAVLLACAGVSSADAWLARPGFASHQRFHHPSMFGDVFPHRRHVGFERPRAPVGSARSFFGNRPQQAVVRPRDHKVFDLGDVFELHVEAREHNKLQAFAFDVREGVLAIADRFDKARLDERFRLPPGVHDSDIKVRTRPDRLILVIPKGSTVPSRDQHSQQNTPDQQQQPVRSAEDQAKPNKPQQQKQAAQEQIFQEEDPDLELLDDDEDRAVDVSGEPDSDAAEGFFDNRGDFHFY
ncbi:unnamed protein product [Durusdinium trenchii]|uniref:SHSP domain-containing protein n=1 Tax=Durusdinium trenchii TaxID=1381693 RepID=A0ABP0ITH1_9DINO